MILASKVVKVWVNRFIYLLCFLHLSHSWSHSNAKNNSKFSTWKTVLYWLFITHYYFFLAVKRLHLPKYLIIMHVMFVTHKVHSKCSDRKLFLWPFYRWKGLFTPEHPRSMSQFPAVLRVKCGMDSFLFNVCVCFWQFPVGVKMLFLHCSWV